MRGLRATSWQGARWSTIEGTTILRLHKNLASRSESGGDEAWFTASEATSSHGASMSPAPRICMLSLPSPSPSAAASPAHVPPGPQRDPMCVIMVRHLVP